LGTWQQFKKQMDSASVRLTHYVHWTEQDKHDNPVKWKQLESHATRFGIILVNIAK